VAASRTTLCAAVAFFLPKAVRQRIFVWRTKFGEINPRRFAALKSSF